MPDSHRRATGRESPVRYMRAPLAGENGSARKALRRKLGTVQVAAGDALAAQIDLTGNSRGDELGGGIEDVYRGRFAAGGRSAVRPHLQRTYVHRPAHRSLGRSVGIDEAAPGSPAVDQLRRTGFATGEQSRKLRQLFDGQLRQGGRGKEGDGNALVAQKSAELRTRNRRLRRYGIQRRARGERESASPRPRRQSSATPSAGRAPRA